MITNPFEIIFKKLNPSRSDWAEEAFWTCFNVTSTAAFYCAARYLHPAFLPGTLVLAGGTFRDLHDYITRYEI